MTELPPITVRLLGTPVLHLADGTAVELRQKAYVLAALLHLEYQGRVRRSTVAERIWESSTGEQAMNNLRQTLLQTRRLEERFAFQLFKSDTTHVELNSAIMVDLRELGRVRLAGSGAELATLVLHYRGELLGDAGDLGPDLAHWRQAERTRIEQQFAMQAAEAALRIGDREALAALDDLATRMPLSEEICRAQLQLLMRAGNTSAARALLDSFAARTVHELGIGPSPETIALLAPPEPERPSATILQLSDARARNAPVQQRQPFVPRVVLLPPLQESKYAGLSKHLAPALIDDVTIRLTRLRTVSVIAPHTAWNLDPFSALDDARSHQIDYAVESRIAPDFASEALTISIRLVRTATREIVWTDKFAFSLGATPEVYWDFTNGIARALADNIEASELAHERTLRDANAYVHYLDGRHHLSSFDLPKVRRGRKSLRLAREIDPGQASIESALARSYVVEWVLRAGSDRSLLDKARLHAERAVAIDPNDGTAYRELGRAALFDRDLDLSLEHMERAAQLAPHHADVLADYADTLVHNSQHVAAQEKIEEAIRLNPVPPDEYHWTFAGASFLRGRFEEALSHLNLMRNPEPAMRLMAASAAMAGQHDLARKCRLKVLEQQPDFSIMRWTSRMPQRSPNDVELYIEALRRAGFQ